MDNSTPELMRYLDGEMDENEQLAFEARMSVEFELRREVERLQLARDAVRSFGLKQEIGLIHTSMMKELAHEPVKQKREIRKIIRYTISVAATIALVFFIYQVYQFYQLSPGKLFTQTYIPYDPSRFRNSDTAQSTSPSAIEDAYIKKDYRLITSMVLHRPFTPKEGLLRGLAFLETGDLSRAVTSFQTVLIEPYDKIPTITRHQLEYYLALAYLKNRDYDQALELMEKVHDEPNHTYTGKFTRKYIRKVKMLKWR
jgi:tetratricopeptide (TPR) repeat protein